MSLTGKQLQDICSALIDAYQSLDDLRIMVRFELNEKLEAIASGDNLRVVVFNLTTWAERTGRVDDLVEGAWRHNSGNAALQALAQAWRVNVPPDAPALPTQPSLGTEAAKPAAPVSIDVFLSYSRKDRDAMCVVRDSLRESGLSVWTDEGLEPGTPSWKNAISEAVGQAQAFVVLLSPYARESIWVNNETSYARTFDKRIFPVLVAGDSKSAVPIDLINAQWLDGREYLRAAVLQRLLPLLRRGQDSSPLPTTSAASAAAKEGVPRKEGTRVTKPGIQRLPFVAIWTALNCAGFAVGGAVAEAVAVAVTGGLVSAQTGLTAVVLAGAVLGAAAGASQWILLRRHFSGGYWWVLASAAGMAVAAAALTLFNQVPLQAGAVIGVAAGASQWIVLRRHFSDAYWWVLASVVGIAVGYAVSYSLNLDPIHASFEGIMYGVVSGAVSRGVGGAIGGAITAIPMFTLLQHPRVGDRAEPVGTER